MLNVGHIEKSLIAVSSEMRRPFAALESASKRHALNVNIVLEIDSAEDLALVITSDGGVWRGRRYEIVLPLHEAWQQRYFLNCADFWTDFIEQPIFENPDGSRAYPVGWVKTSNGDGKGEYSYYLPWAVVAYYARGALSKLGQYIAVREMGDPFDDSDGYPDPIWGGPRRTFEEYCALGLKRVQEKFDKEMPRRAERWPWRSFHDEQDARRTADKKAVLETESRKYRDKALSFLDEAEKGLEQRLERWPDDPTLAKLRPTIVQLREQLEKTGLDANPEVFRKIWYDARLAKDAAVLPEWEKALFD